MMHPTLETNRRSFITGLISFVAAPAIVRVTSIMPIKAIVVEPIPQYYRTLYHGNPVGDNAWVTWQFLTTNNIWIDYEPNP